MKARGTGEYLRLRLDVRFVFPLDFHGTFRRLTFKAFYKWRLLFPSEFCCVIGNVCANAEV